METLELKISIEKDKKTVENAVINYWEKTSNIYSLQVINRS